MVRLQHAVVHKYITPARSVKISNPLTSVLSSETKAQSTEIRLHSLVASAKNFNKDVESNIGNWLSRPEVPNINAHKAIRDSAVSSLAHFRRHTIQYANIRYITIRIVLAK